MRTELTQTLIFHYQKQQRKILLSNCSNLKEKIYSKNITLLNNFFNTNKNVNFS